MKLWKRMFALLLCLVLCLGVLPGMAHGDYMRTVMTANEFITYLQYVVNRGDSRYGSGDEYSIGKYDGTNIFFDCWGLGESIICSKGSIVYNRDTTLNPWNLWDTSCGCGSYDGDWLESQCITLSGDFSNMIPGEWLFREDSNGHCYHVGYYAGKNNVIESTSDGSYNTQITTIDSNGHSNIRSNSWTWTYHGTVPWIDYRDPYIAECTYYPSHCVVKMYKDFRMWSLPCSNETDPSSEIVASNISKNEELTVTAMYKNTAESSAHYWYRVKRSNGQEGYVYCPFTDFQRCLNDDVYITGENYPVLSEPKSFSITGQIRADYCQIDTVRGAIVGTSSDLTVPVNGQYYDLHHSDIDYALAFNSLSPNTTYTYLIQATCSSNYCASRTNNPLCSQPATVTLINHTFTVGGHTHDYNQRGYEAAHPHKVYVKCSCGDWYYTGETEIVTSCDECKTEYMDPGKPELIGLKTLYRPNENIVFVWNDTVNTTHYNLYTEQRNGGGSYEDLSADFYAVSGMVKTLPVGDYRVLLQSTNSNYWTDDGSTWRYTNGDWSYFQVAEEITSYTITYDANGGTGAPAAQTKTQGQPLTLSTARPTREGYEFLGWAESSNATAAEYQPGGSFTKDADTTLYAVWNETSSGDLPTLFLENKSVAPGEIVTLDVVLKEPIMAKALLFYQFEFDRSALTLIKGEWKLNNAIIANWDTEEEIASAAFAQNMQLEGGVFSLTFQVKDNANGTYHIGLSPIIKVLSGTQETELEVDFQPGTLNVSPHKPGDANGDGAVTSDDAIYLLYHCFFPDVYPVTQSCDFNGDGAEDDADAIYLLYHVFFPDLYPIG